jgi:acetylserotonin O-methyltransferase
MTPPDPSPVIDLIEAFRRSKTMFTAVHMGIFDRLERGPASLETLAAELPANADALERLLDGCVGLGLLKKLEAGGYGNTPMSSVYLCRSSPLAMTGYVLYSDEVLFPMWAGLEDAIREGTHRWASEGPLWDQFFSNPEKMRTFLMGMHGFGVLSSPKVVAAFDLSRFHKLVDLGGATGHLALAARERYPNLRAALFDLPPVVEFAREHAAGRIELIPGDFFADELPEADLYAAGRILHDWSEDKINTLLRKIYERLPAEGAVLIAEKLLAPDKSGPVSAQMQSLNMLICTEGKERTLKEYEALLRAAGFSEVQGKITGAPVDAVLATK